MCEDYDVPKEIVYALTMMCQKKLCMHLYTYIGTTTFANGLFTQAYVCKHDTL